MKRMALQMNHPVIGRTTNNLKRKVPAEVLYVTLLLDTQPAITNPYKKIADSVVRMIRNRLLMNGGRKSSLPDMGTPPRNRGTDRLKNRSVSCSKRKNGPKRLRRYALPMVQ